MVLPRRIDRVGGVSLFRALSGFNWVDGGYVKAIAPFGRSSGVDL